MTTSAAMQTATSTLSSTDIEPIIRLAMSRGVHIDSDGESLRVRGPQQSIAILRPHLVANKSAIVEYLAANPMPCGFVGGQGGDEGASQSRSTTPLEILSRIAMTGQYRPSEADIDLALWLTQVAIEKVSDQDPGITWIDGTAIRIADMIISLTRGPRQDIRPAETPTLWLDRIRQFRRALERSRQWRSSDYRVRDWPAELKRERKEIVPPKSHPVDSRKVA